MAKQEFLQLGRPYEPKKHMINGAFMSEKLDGVRFFWDGGVSRGIPAAQVPWANTAKDHIKLKEVIATGLWSRYGHPYHAPDWFLDQLPAFMVDGELWKGRKMFQQTTSAVKKLVPLNLEWGSVTAMVLDYIHPEYVLADREIDNKPHFVKSLRGCLAWYRQRRPEELRPHRAASFRERHSWLKANLHQEANVQLHHQIQLPMGTPQAKELIEETLTTVLALSGEGLILKSQSCLWEPERSNNVLKVKPAHDMEAEVIGYTWGRETDRGSKLLGMMGAMVCKCPKGMFKLSGFTDAQRRMTIIGSGQNAATVGSQHPGEAVVDAIENPLFPRGSQITLAYRELTDDGLPKEGRFLRKFEP